MRTPEKMALRPYLEAIRQSCAPLSKNDLLEMILTMAGDIPAAERPLFLRRIESLLPGAREKWPAKLSGQDAAVREIGKLERSILKRIRDIENGDFNDWNEYEDDRRHYRGGYDYYEDDDIDMLGEEHKKKLAALFDEAGRFFLREELDGARTIFARLFALLGKAEKNSGTWIDCGVDLREARARYCRCLYELTDQASRVGKMADAMEIEATSRLFEEGSHGGYPLLRDVIDSRPGDLPDFDTFLPAWEKLLAAGGCKGNRLAELRLETASLRGGIAEVRQLAREWGAAQPLGYLAWLSGLQDGSAWRDLKAAAAEVLAALPAGRHRAAAAQFLIAAGENLHDDEAILEGKRERFAAEPGACHLLSLVTEAGRQQVRERELALALEVLAKQKKRSLDETVLQARILLMAGRLDRAFAMAEKAKAVGWSYGSPVGVVFAAILHLACDTAKCDVVPELLRDYARDSDFLYHRMTQENGAAVNDFEQEIKTGLVLVDPTPAELARYRKWAEDIGLKHVRHIVGDKHRSAYNSAARVLCSLAETMTACGEKNKARALLLDYCKTRFNRHVAFRREVKKVVSASSLLRGLAADL